MKLVVSYLVGVLNLALAAWGLYKAMPVLGSSIIQAVTQTAVMAVPFGSVAACALRVSPHWMWSLAFTTNALLMLAALAMGFFGLAKPEYAALQGLAFFAGIFPILNLAFLLYRSPKKANAAAEQSA